jgi:multidrug efflux system outer membrane protein
MAALPAFASVLVLSTLTAAQPPPKPPAAPAPQPPSSVVPSPPQVEVNDPLLAPVPPAAHILNNWKEALNYILTRSVDVATAVQEVEKAEGASRQALALALPTITGTFNVTGQVVTGQSPAETTTGTVKVGGVTGSFSVPIPQTPLPPVNPTALATLTASMPIFAPRSWYGIKTADMTTAISRLSLEDKKRTIFAGVASAIINVFTAEQTAEVNRNGLRAALQTLDLTRRQFRLGSATRLDVLRVEQNAATARATLVSGDEALRQARESLGIALGFGEAWGVPSTITLNEIDETLQNVCKSGPLEDRADIAAARETVAVNRRLINDVWLQFAPTATLSTSASLANSAALQADGHIGAWQIQGLLTIPFWDGGARYGSLRIAKANHEEAKLTLEGTRRTANIALTQAIRGVEVADREQVVSQNSRDLAKEADDLTLKTYLLGTGTSFDLVLSGQTLRAAELDLIVKKFAVIQAKLTALLAASNCNY